MRHRRVIDIDGVQSTLCYALEIKRPHMFEAFYEYFGAIDVHDHLRQGSLAMEKEWLTHKWWHRILATIFGMVVVTPTSATDSRRAARTRATTTSSRKSTNSRTSSSTALTCLLAPSCREQIWRVQRSIDYFRSRGL